MIIYRNIKVELPDGQTMTVLAKGNLSKYLDYEDADGHRGEEKEAIEDVEILNLDDIHNEVLKAVEFSDVWFYPQD